MLDEESAAAYPGGHPGMLGMITRVRGRIDGQATRREAVALLEGSEMRLELARALLEAGEHDRALDEAVRIGATRIAPSPSRPGARAEPRHAELTPDERRVAGLAAEVGDREIAEALWVTRRTVELQLSSALAKLGVRSRGDLARALALP